MTPRRAGEVKCTPRQCEEMSLHYFLFFLHTLSCHKVTCLLSSSYSLLKSFVLVSAKCYEPLKRRTCTRAQTTEVCQSALTVLVSKPRRMPELSSVALVEHMQEKNQKSRCAQAGCIYTESGQIQSLTAFCTTLWWFVCSRKTFSAWHKPIVL